MYEIVEILLRIEFIVYRNSLFLPSIEVVLASILGGTASVFDTLPNKYLKK